MKKLLFVLVAAAAIIAAGCSEESRAKASAKKYLDPKSNDGDIEIVSVNLSDYEYEYCPEKETAELELIQITKAAEEEMDDYDLYKGIDNDEAKMHLDLASTFLDKADSLEKVIKGLSGPKYTIKKGEVKARGNNAFGAKVINDYTLYFSQDCKHCSEYPSTVIPSEK